MSEMINLILYLELNEQLYLSARQLEQGFLIDWNLVFTICISVLKLNFSSCVRSKIFDCQ